MDCRPSQTHEPKGEVMRGYLLFVLLLAPGLATSVAQTDNKPEAEHAATAAKTQVKKAAPSRQKKEAQAQTKAPQQETPEAHAKTKNPQEQTETAQLKT